MTRVQLSQIAIFELAMCIFLFSPSLCSCAVLKSARGIALPCLRPLKFDKRIQSTCKVVLTCFSANQQNHVYVTILTL